MHRRMFGLVLLSFVVGCGGARPTALSTTARPVGNRLLSAAKNEDLKTIEQTMEMMERQDRFTSEEADVFKAVYDYARKGNWSSAQSLLERSLAMSQ